MKSPSPVAQGYSPQPILVHLRPGQQLLIIGVDGNGQPQPGVRQMGYSPQADSVSPSKHSDSVSPSKGSDNRKR